MVETEERREHEKIVTHSYKRQTLKVHSVVVQKKLGGLLKDSSSFTKTLRKLKNTVALGKWKPRVSFFLLHFCVWVCVFKSSWKVFFFPPIALDMPLLTPHHHLEFSCDELRLYYIVYWILGKTWPYVSL